MSPYFKLTLVLLFSYSLKAQVPTATIVAPSATICSGVKQTFTCVASNTPTTFNWAISPSSQVTITPDQTGSFVDLTFGKSGVYTLSLQVSNGTGSAVTTQTIGVTQSAKAAFNASLTNTGYPTQMILTNYSTYTVGNLWTFSDAAPDNSIHTIHDYTASGNYTITLTANGTNGCNSISSYSFRIADSSGITLPNVFTPNNDSINDIYKPVARGISKMSAYVYDRFGTLIYSWNKINGYWDGYTTSGEQCQPGVYFCVLEASGFDGKSYKLKSKVTLLR